MTPLHLTAQAVLDQWDLSEREWHKQRLTADLIADLRFALEQSTSVCTNTAPVRAYRLTLALGADTSRDTANALRNLADRIEHEKVTTGVWGGPSDGAVYELLIDPAMTHEAYHAALREYLGTLDNGKAAK